MKKRVLYLITFMDRAGAETLAMNYLRNIDRTKYDIDFLINRAEKSDYEDEIESQGSHVYHMCALNPFKISQYKREFESFLDTHPEYDIIHSHLEEKSVYALQIARKRGIKVRIVHSHSNPTIKDIKYFMRLYLKRKLKGLYTKGLACSEQSARWLWGKNNKNIQIINNAIDTQKFLYSEKKREKIREELGIGAEEIVIGHIGRFSKEKNQKYVIKVFRDIIKKTSAKLLIIGNAKTPKERSLRRELVDAMNLYGLEDNILFLGSRDDMDEVLCATDFVLMPSICEGFPMSLIEAQSCGNICLVSDNITEKINITGNVKFKSLKDGSASWADRIIDLTDRLPDIDRERCSEIVKDKGYDIKEVIKTIENLYQEYN